MRKEIDVFEVDVPAQAWFRVVESEHYIDEQGRNVRLIKKVEVVSVGPVLEAPWPDGEICYNTTTGG